MRVIQLFTISRWRDIIVVKGGLIMPTISRFYGIKISIYQMQKEHNPPHLHALYGEFDAEIDIRTGQQIRGNLLGTALSLTRKWIELHRAELLDMWKTQQFKQLPPLE